MWFEISKRIQGSVSQDELTTAFEPQFRRIARKVQRVGNSLRVESIHATFGSINRSDTTSVTTRQTENGWLVVAEVHYRPSVAFWILLAILIFTWFGWLIPIAFYLTQKNTVKVAISDCLDRVSNEFDQAIPIAPRSVASPISDIERLGSLKEKGLITESEFNTKKKQLLQL